MPYLFHCSPLHRCIKFESKEKSIHYIDISFFKTLTTTVKHSSFSHTLIMMTIIAFITSQHQFEAFFWWVFSWRNNFRIFSSDESQVKLQCLQWYVIYFLHPGLFFRFSDCVSVASKFGFTRTKFQFFNYLFKHTLSPFSVIYTNVVSQKIRNIHKFLKRQDKKSIQIPWTHNCYRLGNQLNFCKNYQNLPKSVNIN